MGPLNGGHRPFVNAELPVKSQLMVATGEEFSHHRADDFPAYIVIFVVGHAIVPAALATEVSYAPPTWLQFLIWLPLAVASALALLQPTKGAVVALQWQLGLGGFEQSQLRRRATFQPLVARSAEGVSVSSGRC